MAKHSGDYYLKEAQKNNLTVKPGKGDHYKIYGMNPQTGQTEMMVCPRNLKGDGTEHSIVKFLVKMGVVLVILLVVYVNFSAI